MYCKNCGVQIDENALACPQCGTSTSVNPPQPQNQQPQYQQPQYQQQQYQQPQYQQPQYQQYQPAPVDDVPNAGFKLLAFCFPIVGLILYLVWKDQKPLTAKAVGKFALIGFVIGTVISIAYFIIMFVILGASDSYDYSYHITNFALRLLCR